jgi:hypothetical protein
LQRRKGDQKQIAELTFRQAPYGDRGARQRAEVQGELHESRCRRLDHDFSKVVAQRELGPRLYAGPHLLAADAQLVKGAGHVGAAPLQPVARRELRRAAWRSLNIELPKLPARSRLEGHVTVDATEGR